MAGQPGKWCTQLGFRSNEDWVIHQGNLINVIPQFLSLIRDYTIL